MYYNEPPPEIPSAQRIIKVSNNTTLNHAINNALPGDRIVLANGSYNGIKLIGLKGTTGAPIVFTAENERQAWISGSTSGRNARLSNCANIEFRGLRFTGASTWGMTIGPGFTTDTQNKGCQNIRILNCEIDNAGQELLKINGNSSNIEVIGNSFHHTGMIGAGKPYSEGIYIGDGNSGLDRSHDILIQGNHIYSIGNTNNWGEAIDIKAPVYNITVVDNLIEDVIVNSQGAITVCIDDTKYPAGQTDPNILISRNVIHNVSHRTNGWNGTGISAGANGITIKNNVIWDTDEASITATKDASNTTGGFHVYNNTLWNGVIINQSSIGSASGNIDAILINNLIRGSGASSNDRIASTNDFIGPLTGDAISRTYTGSGFQLQANSEAVGTGAQIAAVTDDLNGNLRATSASSFGAFEYNTDTSSPIPQIYAVTFIANSGGSVEGFAYQEVFKGGSINSITAVPNGGYSFVNWSGDYTSSENPLQIVNIDQDLNITANFIQNLTLPADPIVVRAINSGGKAYQASDGIYYEADVAFYGGSIVTRANSIAKTLDGPLYQSERYGNFSYSLPLANGDYNVTLQFAEIYWSKNGARIFDSLIEGQLVSKDLDIYQQVGANAAYSITVPVSLADGTLNLNFNASADKPKLSAIRIETAPPEIVIPSYTLTFTANEGGTIEGSSAQELTTEETSGWIIAVPDSGFSFAGWTGGYAGNENPLALSNLTENTSVTANFLKNDVPTTTDPTVVRAINSGGKAYQASDGIYYEADAAFSGGSTVKRTYTVTGTSDDLLYQSERYGNFSYSLPLANGDYNVTLQFAEIYWSKNGARIFDSLIEGQLVSKDLDIYQQVGANAAYSITVPVTLADGTLNLNFNASADKPKLSAIRIETAPPKIVIPSYTLTVAANEGGTIEGSSAQELTSEEPSDWVTAVPDSGFSFTGWTGDYTGSENPLSFTNLTEDMSLTANFVKDILQPTVVRAINSGGKAYQASDGIFYEADAAFSGGSTVKRTYTVAGTSDDLLYQSERYGNFSYSLPLANGDYNVTLQFAEIYWSKNGARVFDSLIEGQLVSKDLDIYQQVGANAAYSITVAVTLTDGNLNLNFNASADKPKLSAIRIETAPPKIVIPSYTLTFTANEGGTIEGSSAQELTSEEPSDWVTAVPDSGFSFAGWTGDYTGSENPLSFTNLTEDMSLTANFVKEMLQPTVVRAINIGGKAYQASDGTYYCADAAFSGGSTVTRANTITGTSDEVLYQSERYGNFSYSLPLENGTYNVTLQFAEIYWTNNGARIFNSLIEDQLVSKDLDIYQQVGANAAYSITVPIILTDGNLNLNFNASADKPKISAIRIETAPPTIVIPSYTLTVAANEGGTIEGSSAQELTSEQPSDWVTAVPDAGFSFAGWTGDYTGSENPLSFTNLTENMSLTANFVKDIIQPTVVRAINSGGKAYQASDGTYYQADAAFSGGSTVTRANSIAETSDGLLYQSERYGNFSYSLPLENGNYNVTLQFAEIYWSNNGARIFDSLIEGQLVSKDLDIYQQVGANAAYSITVPVTLTDGTLNLNFNASADKPKISAIRIETRNNLGN